MSARARGLTQWWLAALVLAGCGLPTPRTQGALIATGNFTDLAIVGDGYFLVRQGPRVSLTRSGEFTIDAQGFLVTELGARLQGFPADSTGALAAQAGDLAERSVVDAVATKTIVVTGNLAADAPNPAEPFDLDNPTSTSNFMVGLTVFDPGGSPQTMQIFYAHRAAGDWAFHTLMDGAALAGGVAGVSIEVASGVLLYDSAGRLVSVTQQTGLTWARQPAPAQLRFDFGDPIEAGRTGLHGLTQFGGTDGISTATSTDQDGAPAGSLIGFQFGEAGLITALYSAGPPRVQWQLGLALVPDVEAMALQCVPSEVSELVPNLYGSLGAPLTGGRGALLSGQLEQGVPATPKCAL